MRQKILDPFNHVLLDKLGVFKFLRLGTDFKGSAERVKNASRFLNKTTQELIQEISVTLDVPYLDMIPAMEMTLLPRKIGLRELRRLCFVPLTDQGVITALAGVNPFDLIRELPEFSHLPFFLTTPEAVLHALVETEKKLGVGAEVLDSEILVQKILARILDFALQQGQESFLIRQTNNELRYFIFGTDNKQLSGIIAESISANVISFCAESARSNLVRVLDGTQLSLKFDLSGDGSEYCIRKYTEIPKKLLIHKTDTQENYINDSRDYSTNHVLLLDDNAEFSRILTRFLERSNFTIKSTTNTAEALHYLESAHEMPVAIITDLHMPGMNGLDFVAHLNKLNRYPLPEIIFLSSDESIDSELDALKKGAVAYMQKSRDPRVLMAHLERICSARLKRAA